MQQIIKSSPKLVFRVDFKFVLLHRLLHPHSQFSFLKSLKLLSEKVMKAWLDDEVGTQ